MAKGTENRELLRVGLPLRAATLAALLAAIEPTEEATVRHYNGQLFVEEPSASLPLDAK